MRPKRDVCPRCERHSCHEAGLTEDRRKIYRCTICGATLRWWDMACYTEAERAEKAEERREYHRRYSRDLHRRKGKELYRARKLREPRKDCDKSPAAEMPEGWGGGWGEMIG